MLPLRFRPTGSAVAGPRPEGLGKPPLPAEPGQARKGATVGRTLGACGFTGPRGGRSLKRVEGIRIWEPTHQTVSVLTLLVRFNVNNHGL